MASKNRSNLGSPNQIVNVCNLVDVRCWFENELTKISELPIRKILLDIVTELDAFVKWPTKAVLLWDGCDRNTKYHRYSDLIKHLAREQGIRLDGRVNGPAIAAYKLGGGVRPPRFGSHNCWSVHHIYSGKFPYPGRSETLHAAKHSKHFTQSAGLVAVHPLADQACDEYPAFAWLLRAISFQKFGYDPDRVFSDSKTDEFGFAGQGPLVIPTATSE